MENDSSKNDALDQYGVWVKTPPHNVQTENTPSESKEENAIEDIGLELADFSFLDSIDSGESEPKDNKASSVPEVEPHADSTEDALNEKTEQAASEDSFSLDDMPDGEISLDEFFTSPSAADTRNSEQGEKDIPLEDFLTSSDSNGDSSNKDFQPDGEISLDSFLDSDASSQEQKNEAEESFDEPLDIDLTFDESPLPIFEEEEVETKPDLTEFTTTDDESIDLSEFLGDTSSFSEEAKPEAEPVKTTEDSSISQTAETESIDLSEFGIIDDSSSGTSNNEGTESSKKADKQDFNLTVSTEDDESPAAEDTVNDEEEDGNISIAVEEKKESPAKENDVSSSPASSSDDFDVDALLNSIEDVSTGTSTSLGDEKAFSTEPTSTTAQGENNENTEEASTQKEVEDKEPTVEEEFAIEEADSDFSDIQADKQAAETSNIDISDFMGEEGFSDPSIAEGNRSYSKEELEENNKASQLSTNSSESDNETVAENEKLVDNRSISGFPAEEMKQNEESKQAGEEIMDTTTPNTSGENLDSLALLNKIATELTTLKSEILDLRTEFDAFKKNGAPAQAEESTVAEEDELPLPETQSSNDNADSGFFSDMADDDDTIALSGDELSNILNTAEFTEQGTENSTADDVKTESDILGSVENAAEVPDEISDTTENNLGMDFSQEEALEEPDLDNVDLSADSEESEEEISVPKSDDDILVESSSTDLIQEASAQEAEVEADSEDTAEAESTEELSEAEESSEAETQEPLTVDNIIATVKEDERFKEDFIPVENESTQDDYSPLDEPLAIDETEDSKSSFEEPFVSSEETSTSSTEEESFEEPEVVETSDTSDTEESEVSSEESTSDAEAAQETSESGDSEEEEETEEDIETGISEDTTEDVFDKWDSAPVDEETVESSESRFVPSQEEPVSDVTEQENTAEEVAEEPVAETSEVPSEEVPSAEEAEVEPESSSEETSATEEAQEAPAPITPITAAALVASSSSVNSIPEDMKQEIRSVLSYMDQLLESLPEEKIAEFAKSEQFNTYKKLFTELGLS